MFNFFYPVITTLKSYIVCLTYILSLARYESSVVKFTVSRAIYFGGFSKACLKPVEKYIFYKSKSVV